MAPTVLILGGLGQDGARHLLVHLTAASGRASFVRVVDKYLIIPAAGVSTTYLDKDTKSAFKDGAQSGTVEYMQGNLLNLATREKAFALPEVHGGPSKGFDYIFDFTGESDYDLPEAVHIERTLKLALLLGQSAVESEAGVYLRMLATQYKAATGSKDTGLELEPFGTRAEWMHEAARGLAKMEGLKLVLLRPAFFYGPYTLSGVTPRVLIGEVYRFQGEKLEFLWKESTAMDTIHASDFCAAALAAAAWALPLSRADLLSSPAIEQFRSTLTSKTKELLSSLPLAAKADEVVSAPVFNLSDDGATTQSTIARVIQDVLVGLEAGFHGNLISAFAQMNLGSVLEDVNEKHLEGWSELLTASDPPISTTSPLSPNTPVDLLQPYPIQFPNAQTKKLLNWQPEYTLTADVVRQMVEKFKEEGIWPRVKPKSKAKGKK